MEKLWKISGNIEILNLSQHKEEGIVYIKTDDIFKDVAEDVGTKFRISNYEVECNSTERSLPIAKSEKAIGLMKNELQGKTMTTFVGLRAKTYSYLIDDGSEEKRKAKDTKKCVLRRKPKFKYYKNCVKGTQLENEINFLEKKNKIDIDTVKEFMKKQQINVKNRAKVYN